MMSMLRRRKEFPQNFNIYSAQLSFYNTLWENKLWNEINYYERPLTIDVSKNAKTTAKNPRMRDCGVSFSFSALSNAGGELGNSSWGTF